MKGQPVEMKDIGRKSGALVILMALLLAAVGCGQSQPATATPPPAPTGTPAPAATSTPAPTATAMPEAEAAFPEDLFLHVLEPLDESIVNELPLVVVGRTTPDAVVSVDGEGVEVNARGEIVALVSLQPGPNLIEIVASDLTGRQETALLSVIYLP